MLIIVQPDPNWQLSLAQLSPSLFCSFILILKIWDKRNIKKSMGVPKYLILKKNAVSVTKAMKISWP